MDYVPGSILFTHRDSLMSKAIVAGQNLRFRGERRKYAHWSHVAIIVSAEGDIVEALSGGVCRGRAHKYWNTDAKIRIPEDIWRNEDAQERVVHFAEHAVGREYGWTENASLGLYLLSGTGLRFGIDGQMNCSGLAAGALSRTNAIFPREPMYMMPADLAEYYDVA